MCCVPTYHILNQVKCVLCSNISHSKSSKVCAFSCTWSMLYIRHNTTYNVKWVGWMEPGMLLILRSLLYINSTVSEFLAFYLKPREKKSSVTFNIYCRRKVGHKTRKNPHQHVSKFYNLKCFCFFIFAVAIGTG